MPKKPSTVLVMQAYRPLSSRRFYQVEIKTVCRRTKVNVRVELAVLDDPQQAGRTVAHDLPAVLAPDSPLCEFLADGFGIRLTENQSFDLAALVGRVLEARFSKVLEGRDQAIAAIRRFEETTRKTLPATSVARGQDRTGGLG